MILKNWLEEKVGLIYEARLKETNAYYLAKWQPGIW